MFEVMQRVSTGRSVLRLMIYGYESFESGVYIISGECIMQGMRFSARSLHLCSQYTLSW